MMQIHYLISKINHPDRFLTIDTLFANLQPHYQNIWLLTKYSEAPHYGRRMKLKLLWMVSIAMGPKRLE